jgi:hypothetical protein
MAEEKPRAPVRRFDVFAEYNRLKALKEGQSAAQAKSYGLWVAKVVAAQKFGRLPKPTGEKKEGEQKQAKPEKKKKWHELSGIPQTDKLYDKEIVNRMGKEFYKDVFAPAIHTAFEQGKTYPEIRDAIRREWKPAKT